MKFRQWVVAAVLLSIVAAGVSGCSLAESGSNVGVIDIERIVKESPSAQAYQKQLADKLEALRKRAEQETADLGAEEKEKKEREIYAEYLALKQELEGKLENEINAALKQVVQDTKVNVVIYRESVRFGGVDVTGDVIEKMKK